MNAVLEKAVRDRDHYRGRAEYWQERAQHYEHCYENCFTAFLVMLLIAIGEFAMRWL